MAGKAFERKVKQDRPWDCPICGGADLRHPTCPKCQAEVIRFAAPEPDERGEGPLLRLAGRVLAVYTAIGTGARASAGTRARVDPDAWSTSFDLELPTGAVVAVACRPKTWARVEHDQAHYLAALRPGAQVQVLARVEALSPRLHGDPPASSEARLGARAQVVTLGRTPRGCCAGRPATWPTRALRRCPRRTRMCPMGWRWSRSRARMAGGR